MKAIAPFIIAALAGCSDSSTSPTPIPTPTPSAPPALTASVNSVQQLEVIEKNSVFWRYSWRVSVNANGDGDCFLRTKYLDGNGLELHEGIEMLSVTKGSASYTGQDLIDADLAPRVETFEPFISSCF